MHTMWKTAFLLEGAVMAPCAIVSFLILNELEKDNDPVGAETSTDRPQPTFGHEVWALATNPIWMTCTLGYAAFTFVIGDLALPICTPPTFSRR